MYFLGCGIERFRNRQDLEKIFSHLKPFLKHGTIVLTSNFQNLNSLLSPTPIKHSSFCYIENDIYYAVELSETSQLKKYPFIDFLKKRDTIFLFDYYDPVIMNKTMNYVFNYKNKKYGFFGNSEYCYKLIFDVYNDVYEKEYNKKYKNMSDFFPVINFFGLEYVNSNSILRSKKFVPTCCLINNMFIKMKPDQS